MKATILVLTLLLSANTCRAALECADLTTSLVGVNIEGPGTVHPDMEFTVAANTDGVGLIGMAEGQSPSAYTVPNNAGLFDPVKTSRTNGCMGTAGGFSWFRNSNPTSSYTNQVHIKGFTLQLLNGKVTDKFTFRMRDWSDWNKTGARQAVSAARAYDANGVLVAEDIQTVDYPLSDSCTTDAGRQWFGDACQDINDTCGGRPGNSIYELSGTNIASFAMEFYHIDDSGSIVSYTNDPNLAISDFCYNTVSDCVPDCTNKECGGDGCGGECTTSALTCVNAGDTCVNYQCTAGAIYEENFNINPDTSSWTTTTVTDASNVFFLGPVTTSNTLSLTNVASHTSLLLSFRLYLFGSWGQAADDVLVISTDLGGVALKASFSHNSGLKQTYPLTYCSASDAQYPAYTSAVAQNTLSGGGVGSPNSIYSISVRLLHNNDTLALKFAAEYAQYVDQKFGIDDITVDAITTRSWLDWTSPLAETQASHRIGVIGNRFFVVGGQTEKDGVVTALNTVTEVASGGCLTEVTMSGGSAPGRHDHVMVVHGSTLVVFGGFNGAYLNDVWKYVLDCPSSTSACTATVSQFVTSGSAPSERYASSGAIIGDVMYVFGGVDITASPLNDLYSLDLITGVWTAVNPSTAAGPNPVGFASMEVMSSCLYVFGGENWLTGTKYNGIYMYCPGTSSAWVALTPTGTAPAARAAHASSQVRDRMVIFGGENSEGYVVSDFFEYRASTNEWIEITSTDIPLGTWPPARKSCVMAVTDTHTVLHGGEDDGALLYDTHATTFVPLDCQPGTYLPVGSSVCVSCAKGSFSATSNLAACESCAAGSFANVTGLTSCELCPPGTYNGNTGGDAYSSCSQCPIGTYSGALGATSSSVCTSCPAGSYADSTGTGSCTLCPAGTASTTVGATTSTVCSTCPSGTYAPSGSSECIACPAGTEGRTSGLESCTPCSSGSYGAGGSDVCSSCPTGTYRDGTGATSISQCLSCPEGTEGLSSGLATCSACAEGYYGSGGTTACSGCPVGTFRSTTGGITISDCSSCAPGSYAASTGQAACTVCPTGTYNPNTGSTALSECLSCPGGTFSGVTGATNITDCGECPAGYYSIAGSEGCTACSAGTYSSTAGGSGASSCLLCEPNTFSSSVAATTCQACAANHFSLVGWSSCAPCSAASSDCTSQQYKRTISVPSTTVGVPVRIVLTTSNFNYAQVGMTNGEDMQVYSSEGVLLSFWIQTWNTAGNSIIWFRPITTGTTEVTLRYGASCVTTSSSGVSTFELFDDFDDASVNPLLWTYTDTSSSGLSTAETTTLSRTASSLQAATATSSFATAESFSSERTLEFDLTIASFSTGAGLSIDLNLCDSSVLSVIPGDATWRWRDSLGVTISDAPIVTGSSHFVTVSIGTSTTTVSIDGSASRSLSCAPSDLLFHIDVTASVLSSAVDVAIDNARAYSSSAYASASTIGPEVAEVSAQPYEGSGWLFNGQIDEAGGHYTQPAAYWDDLGTTSYAYDTTTTHSGTSSGSIKMEATTNQMSIIAEQAIFAGVSNEVPIAVFVNVAASSLQAGSNAYVALIVEVDTRSSPDVYTEVARIALPTGSYTWRREETSFTHSVEIRHIKIRLQSYNTKGSVWFDDIGVYSVPGAHGCACGTAEYYDYTTSASSCQSACLLGTDGAVTAPSWSLGGGATTFEVWVQPQTATTSARLFDFNSGSGAEQAYLAISGSNMDVVFGLVQNSATTTVTASSALTVGTWTHIAVITDTAGLTTILIDGASAASGQTGVLNQVTRTSHYIGQSASNTDYFDGFIDEFRVWSMARTVDQVNFWLYRTPSSGITEHLDLRYDFESATELLTTVADVSGNGRDGSPTGSIVFAEHSCPKSHCWRCEAGFACNAGTQQRCEDTKFSQGGASVCRDVLTGWTTADGIATPCGLTNTMANQVSMTCDACTAGAWCGDGTEHICPAGKYVAPDGCRRCNPGTITATSGLTACVNCPEGQTSNYKRDYCMNCPAGEYNATPGDICKVCPPGSYSSEGATTCTACPKGTYMSYHGAHTCEACPTGTTTGGTGSTSSSACV